MILIMAAVATITATAQSVTYNHDSSKQNQITVMETGGGSLTPEFYYWLLHNSYKKTAAEKNKLGFRTLAGINLYNQVDDAEKIDSALTKRAEVEALNVADREIDLAWLAESSKINGQLDKMKESSAVGFGAVPRCSRSGWLRLPAGLSAAPLRSARPSGWWKGCFHHSCNHPGLRAG